jgi:hypothetical protein
MRRIRCLVDWCNNGGLDVVNLRVVSERPAAEIKKEQALSKLGATLSELTANLKLVARGAGKPELIELHTLRVAEAFELYRKEIGSAPTPDDLTAVLKAPIITVDK